MLRALLAKDLRRAWRNPLPWLLNLALPLCITAVIGLVFGGGGDENRLGRIKFAVVDEDQSMLSNFLRGAANQDKAAQYLDPVFLERAAAIKALNDAKLSAVLVIPVHFTSNYLTGQSVQLTLIKNPAEQIHPAVLEEMLGVLTTGLNALSRNFASEFPAWRRVAEGNADFDEVELLLTGVEEQARAVRKYLFPPLIGFTDASAPPAAAPAKSANAAPKFNIFGYLLAGMAGMFLLLQAGQGVADLHRELTLRTFERYSTLRARLLPFLAGKALFCVVIVSLGALILLGGGALVFRVAWPRPLALAALTLAYVCFATGLMSLLIAISPDERRDNSINSIIGMVLSMAGGCMFPPEQLPAFMRERIAPLLPTYWYAYTARQLWWWDASWPTAALKLLAVGAVCLGVAAWLFGRRFREGIRA